VVSPNRKTDFNQTSQRLLPFPSHFYISLCDGRRKKSTCDWAQEMQVTLLGYKNATIRPRRLSQFPITTEKRADIRFGMPSNPGRKEFSWNEFRFITSKCDKDKGWRAIGSLS